MAVIQRAQHQRPHPPQWDEFGQRTLQEGDGKERFNQRRQSHWCTVGVGGKCPHILSLVVYQTSDGAARCDVQLPVEILK
jgi:hypothetical protein